ncbi:MAG: class IV adenylate cyclase [Spirochaetaceae bacterium]|nr:class IV adenylate cyclase [Spirochaetaceae bacterium]
MVEIELKARITDRASVEAALSRRMHFAGTIDKQDEYWAVSYLHASVPVSFRFRIRVEGSPAAGDAAGPDGNAGPARRVVTFKEKTVDGAVEINQEYEFGIDNEEAFRKFMTKLNARFVYAKRKRGTRWESDDGLIAEVVDVEPLGCFLEVECVCDSPDRAQTLAAKQRLYSVLEACGVPASAIEPRPYSQLLGK